MISSNFSATSLKAIFLPTCFAHLLQNCNPGQKSLGQYRNIRTFLSFLGSLLKWCILFENFLQFSLPPTLYKVETRNKFWIQASNIVCGVRGGVGPVWIGKRHRNESGSQYFCPWLCLHQKLQSVTPLNWTCIATFLVHNVKLWSNFRNVFSGLGYSSTKFYPRRFNLEVQLLTLIVYYIYHFSQKR